MQQVPVPMHYYVIFDGGVNSVGIVKERTPKPKFETNNVRKIREGLLMSKAELARRAGLSVLTIDRVEKGMACRMDTKRKIILSLGLQLSDRDKVFTKAD